MKNVMKFDGGYQAVISYDPEIRMFRGEFVGLNGGADFYAEDLSGLEREGKLSLKVFLEECQARGIEPYKKIGNFALRLDPELYRRSSLAAAASGVSLNSFIAEALKEHLETVNA